MSNTETESETLAKLSSTTARDDVSDTVPKAHISMLFEATVILRTYELPDFRCVYRE